MAMKNTFLLLLLAFLSFSCLEKEDEAVAVLPDGTYTGTFTRSNNLGDEMPKVAQVTLVVKGNTFTGTSDTPHYPAIGSGTYKINGQDITFEDERFWTADFDWTLILKGTFALQNTNGIITLTRRQGNLTDVYQLSRKQE
ncbi:hypothetical protein TH63_02490 [Rufibacter radiotolerans]|uniref:Lipocalin-like domain-containing protein n=2 Tax=Rufibacter radiotolerans TaxID=1379910 RepID=A0A0H4VLG1_9BACT|nr:hypothetical protein TH63_02490 [Rufibacter radiotolerans]